MGMIVRVGIDLVMTIAYKSFVQLSKSFVH